MPTRGRLRFPLLRVFSRPREGMSPGAPALPASLPKSAFSGKIAKIENLGNPDSRKFPPQF
jgi:hypothetical protein